MDKLRLVSSLEKGEIFIDGKELLIRANERGANLGQRQAEYCLEHEDEMPECWQDYHTILFTGTVWSDSEDHRFIPCISHVGGEPWCFRFQYIENTILSDDGLIGVRK